MKTPIQALGNILAGLLVITSAAVAADNQAGTEIPRDDVATIPTVDLQTLKEKIGEYDGKIVKLEFNHRAVKFSERADGGIDGGLAIYQPGKNQRYGLVSASVPASGLGWFKRIKTIAGSPNRVFARIEKGEPWPKAEILGREIKTDLKGAKIVW